MTNRLFVTLLDYHVYESVPRLWRAIERALRFDIYLTWHARKLAPQYDIVWAGSEKVAIPWTLLGESKPMVVTMHYPQAAGRATLLKWLNVRQHWQAVGFVSPDDRGFLHRDCVFRRLVSFPPWR